MDQRIRLTMLLGCLGVLVFYLVAARTDVLGPGTGAGQPVTGGAWSAGCPARGAPLVADVAVGQLAELRVDIRSVILGRRRRLYSWGTVKSENAWTDNYPQPGALSLPEGARAPGAYEMRWWSDRDDIVATVFVFIRTARARDFFERASSSRCRPSGAQTLASSPPNARDLLWLNPDRFFQEDVYLLRGNRVYEVSDVRPGSEVAPSSTERQAAFSIVNSLACALPGAGCRAESAKGSPA